MDDATARAAVLQSANEVFYARGIAGVGMADIRDDSGVSLRRLYGLYPSKRELVTAWLTARHTTWMDWFESSVDRRCRAHRRGIPLSSPSARGPWILRSDWVIATSLMLASRRRISPSASNSQSSLP